MNHSASPQSIFFLKFRSHKKLIISASFVLILTFIAFLGPLISTQDPNQMTVANRLLGPSTAHLFGTDEFGRDLFTRVIYGARVSLFIGFTVSSVSSAIGLLIGLYAGYFRFLDGILMRICDGLIAIPGILLAIALMAALGPSIWNIILALTLVYTPNIARTARASVLQVKQQTFIEALRVQGASTFRILFINILPNILSPIFVQTFHVFASAILSEAALSFLGVGITPPDASWGNILQSSKLVINKAWWMVVYPGIAIVFTVLSFNLFGDGLRDYFDPTIENTSTTLKDQPLVEVS